MGNLAQKALLDTSHKWRIQRNLKIAISNGDHDTLEKILQTYGSQCQTFRMNKDGDTALILATKYQDLNAVRLLLKYHAANPNKTNHLGSSALDVALLRSSILTSHVEDILVILAKITSQISLSVLTTVLDPSNQSVENAARIAAFLTRHSLNYSLRAQLLHTLLSYYQGVIPTVLIIQGADPTGLTDQRIDPYFLWKQTNSLRYFKKADGQILPKDLIILLIRAANSKSSVDIMANVILDRIEFINEDDTEIKFYQKALRLLVHAGYKFRAHQLKGIDKYLPGFVRSYCKQSKMLPSLQHLAQITVRHSINTNALHGSKTLPIPRTLQQYICLAS